MAASSVQKDSKHPLLMLSVGAYKGTRPPIQSSTATVLFLVGILVVIEKMLRLLFDEYKVSYER